MIIDFNNDLIESDMPRYSGPWVAENWLGGFVTILPPDSPIFVPAGAVHVVGANMGAVHFPGVQEGD